MSGSTDCRQSGLSPCFSTLINVKRFQDQRDRVSGSSVLCALSFLPLDLSGILFTNEINIENPIHRSLGSLRSLLPHFCSSQVPFLRTTEVERTRPQVTVSQGTSEGERGPSNSLDSQRRLLSSCIIFFCTTLHYPTLPCSLRAVTGHTPQS